MCMKDVVKTALDEKLAPYGLSCMYVASEDPAREDDHLAVIDGARRRVGVYLQFGQCRKSYRVNQRVMINGDVDFVLGAPVREWRVAVNQAVHHAKKMAGVMGAAKMTPHDPG